MKFLVACGILLAGVAGPALAGGELLVGNKSDDTVWRLSLENGRKLGEAATGNAPHEIAVNRGNTLVVVTDYGHAQPGNSLTVIDPVSGKPLRSIGLGHHARPHGVRFLPDGQRALVTAEQSGSLLLVNIAQGVVERVIEVGDGIGHMVALSPDGTVAYVSKIASGTLVRIDLASGDALERPAGAGAEGIEVHADGTVWVTNRDADSVTLHDPASLAVVDTLPSPGFPIRVAFTADGRHALVTNAKAGDMSVFDAGTYELVAKVSLADGRAEYGDTLLGKAALPIGVIADPSAPRVYVAISGGNEIAVVDTDTWQVTERWPTGRQPDALGIVVTD